MSKMNKFEIELPVVPKPAKLSLSERDIAVATMYVCVCLWVGEVYIQSGVLMHVLFDATHFP